jgi:GTP-binding protein EngB required for normal cell division
MGQSATRALRRGSEEHSSLEELARLAEDAAAPAIAEEAQQFAERVTEGRFYVACVGQFKRGKSTLLNALIGASVLPTGVVPVTAAITVLRYGNRLSVRARFADGSWRDVNPADLSQYVSEEGNPNNEKGVMVVEVFVPSRLLASGMCFVDTPGLGSVFEAGTAATRAFVPQIDAALVVLGADPPISGDELELVQEVARHVRDLIFVVNKADRISEAERVEARAFAERILREALQHPVGTILEVSALDRLSGRTTFADWDALVDSLEALARRSGSSLVRAAEERALRLLGKRLLHQLDEHRGALVRPLEESESRIADLRRCAAEAERSLGDLGYVFGGEQDRFRQKFVEHQERLLDNALPEARRELEDSVRTLATKQRRTLHPQAMRLAQAIAHRILERWRTAEEPLAEEAYRTAASRFVDLANQFLERLRTSGEMGMAALPSALPPEIGFRARSHLFYTQVMPATSRSPVEWLADFVSPTSHAVQSAVDRATKYLERLLRSNTSRIVGDLEERLLESRRRLEHEIRTLLREVSGAAERALERAREKHSAGAEAVQKDLQRIEVFESRARSVLGEDPSA